MIKIRSQGGSITVKRLLNYPHSPGHLHNSTICLSHFNPNKLFLKITGKSKLSKFLIFEIYKK